MKDFIIPFPFATTPWKYLSVYFASAVLLFGLSLLLFAYSRQTYLPFKSKQINSLFVAWLANLFYAIASAQSMQLFDPTGIFTDCNFWLMYAYGIFGVSLSFFVMAFRMYRLYYLIVLNKYPKGFQFYYVLFLSYLPMISLTLVSTMMPGVLVTKEPTVMSDTLDGVPGCIVTSPMIALLILLATLFQLIHVWILTFQVSKIGSSFNEFKEDLICLSIITIMWISTTILVITGLSFKVWGKLLIFWLSVLSGASVWALPLLPVVYAYFYRREEYLQEFKAGLFADVKGSHSPRSSRFTVSIS